MIIGFHRDVLVRDNLGLASASRPKDHYIWLLTSQTSVGTLYSSALLGHTLTVLLLDN